MIKLVFFSIFLIVLLVPSLSYAAEQGFVPAICKQVLEPKDGATVAGIVKDYLVEKAKEMPAAAVAALSRAGDSVASALSGKLEASKSPASATGTRRTVQSLYNQGVDGASSLLKHWPWSLAGGLALASLIFFF